jgi:hypothetical protein
MPPPPRIEVKPPGPTPCAAVQDDKEYIPLTNLIAPRLFGLPTTGIGKGKARVTSNNEDPPISDDPFIDQSCARLTVMEDIESDAETFTMRELARGLDVSPSKAGRSGMLGRKGPNKFIRQVSLYN